MSTMHYKSYAARIEYSAEDNCFIGHIAGIRDLIGFHADNVDGLRVAFEKAVDDYMETCEKLGRSPNKAYSGQLRLRIEPELHARAALCADAKGISLNSWLSDAILRLSNKN